MTTVEKIGCGFAGFILSFITAVIATAGLHALFAIFWLPLPSLLFIFGARLKLITTAVAAKVVCLLWWLKSEDVKRGVWCFMYLLVAVAVISLALSLFH